MKKIACLLTLSLALLSCSLEEGEGGKGEISGRVMIQVLYSNPIIGVKDSVIEEYPAVNEKVYIKYGDNSIYDDNFNTDGEGYYKFTGLTKGSYSLSTFTYCKTCGSETKVLEQTVTLKKHDDKIVALTFNTEEKQK
jgi:hypothetical protein